jgi:glyoxylase-like metal-dependent hydrolase (beta-lactamase superfamily II)/ferredoxin
MILGQREFVARAYRSLGMARLADRLPANADGDFYVDSTCIDCATCRELVPATYAQGDGFSYVHRQPSNEEEARRAMMALVACPTGSIGTTSRRDVKPVLGAFPAPVDENVFYCGWTSKSSFGAWSWLIQRPERNVLVDSPRASSHLLARLGEMGGVATMFLTHRDDVADHETFRREFGSERVLHERDVTGGTRGVEVKVQGDEPFRIDDELLVIPTPGHTRGHAVLLYREKYLFTGDHLAWSERRKQLVGFRDACWYSWEEQTRSMERLLDYRFEWVLPGHGATHHAPSAAVMRDELARCVAWMKRTR